MEENIGVLILPYFEGHSQTTKHAFDPQESYVVAMVQQVGGLNETQNCTTVIFTSCTVFTALIYLLIFVILELLLSHAFVDRLLLVRTIVLLSSPEV